MSTKIENNFRQSKQAASYIHKFNYHLQHTVPSFLPSTNNQSSPQQSPTIASKKGLRSMNFHFAEHSVEGVGTIDAQTILLSALKIYVGPDCVKLSQSSYKKNHTMKASYLPIYGQFEEIIEFCLVDNNEEILEKTSSKWAKQSRIINSKTKDSDKQNSVLKSTMKTPLSNNYELFVIHYCHSQEEKKNHIKWESVTFILFSLLKNITSRKNFKTENLLLKLTINASLTTKLTRDFSVIAHTRSNFVINLSRNISLSKMESSITSAYFKGICFRIKIE